ncbi:MAG TPA: DUF4389 domain-containing protein [Dehalococcoidia bacterium]|nr:DUF4389 domain-containing protein [Dehalococcoidia bacterium]
MSYPVTLTVDHPDKLSRGVLLLKVFLGWLYVGIPHGFVLWLYQIAVSIVMFIVFWAILFAGKFPKGMFDFVVGYTRWNFNVSAYMGLLTDDYPPFSGEENASYPVILSVDHPDKLSRGVLLLKVFLGWLYVGIPHGFMLTLYAIAVAVVMFIAFWAILFAGKFPRGMFDFVVGFRRWLLNVQAYMCFLTDEYPPFSGEQK